MVIYLIQFINLGLKDTTLGERPLAEQAFSYEVVAQR
jgi:hypothetical protein